MVDIKDEAGIAFSTIFTSRKNFTENDIKIDSRMIRGLGPQGVQAIVEGARIARLGTFLKQDPEELAVKIRGKSASQIENIQRNAEEAFLRLRDTIEDPFLVIKDAIYQCFELLGIPNNQVRTAHGDEDAIIFSTQDYSHVVTCKPVNWNTQADKVNTKVSENKIHSFNVEWVFRGVTGSKWGERINKAAAWAIESYLNLAIPAIGGVLGGFTRKKFERMKEKELVDEINYEIDEIFYNLLKSNLAIEYIGYDDRRLSHSSVVHT